MSPPVIRFSLNGEIRNATVTDPTRTVLQYLREDLGHTGTKEGCAEGDCGACTVVVLERMTDGTGERLRCRAVNSCIQFLPTLDGKGLLTVEGLKRGGKLHPVQQALADCHGSQCGFCTPGFVMSLFALYKTDPAPDRRAINDALAGNLCRCTGYRPIADAAREMYVLGRAVPPAERDWMVTPAEKIPLPAQSDESKVLAQLRAIERTTRASFAGPKASFHAPRTVDDLAALCERHPEARLVAGGTDVGLWVTKGHRALGDIIYTGNVAELATVIQRADWLEIGATATITDVMPYLVQAHPEFGELLRRFGSPPIRNAATLAGNIANASPVGDSMPGLIALGAEILLRQGAATRRIRLEDFYLDYRKTALGAGEFVERVLVPLPRPGLVFRTYKLSKRFDQDISAVCGAFAATVESGTVRSIRIAYGGMAPTPRRAAGAEAALAGKPWSDSSARAAMTALDGDYAPISDMRASAGYRRDAARNLLYRFYLESSGTAGPRLYDAALVSGDLP